MLGALRKAWPFTRDGQVPQRYVVYGTTPAELYTAWSRGPTPGTQQWVPGSAGSYEAMYQEQPWVYVCVNKLSRAIARLPLPVYELDLDTGNRELVRRGGAGLGSDLATLLHEPFPRGSAFQLLESVVASLSVYGAALLLKQRPSASLPPTELWPVPWQSVEVSAPEGGPPSSYTIVLNGVRHDYAPEEVVHFQWWSPLGYGVSPLEPLRAGLAAESAAAYYAEKMVANGIRPSGAITTDRTMKKEQSDAIQKDIQEAYAGPGNIGRLLFLTGGMDWKPFAMSAADAQLIETRKLTREEVCAVYDIPPPIVHILDHATYSNIDEQHKMLYQDTLGPPLAMLEQALSAQLVEPDFDENLFVEFKLDDVLRGDIEKRSSAYGSMMHVYTPNEQRKLENLPEIDSPLADAIYLPLNSQPVPEPPEEEQPVEEVPPPEETPLTEEEQQLLAAIGSLRAKEANGDGVH